MRRRTYLVVMALAGLVVLAGCGGDDTEAAGGTTVPGDADTASSVLNATTASTEPGAPSTTTTSEAPSTTTTSESTASTAPTTTATTSPSTTASTSTTTTEPAGFTADLTVTISDPFGDDTSFAITCPSDSTACDRLAKRSVQVRLIDGPPRDQACTMQFGSGHQARIVGTVNGQAVDAGFARNDGCAIGDWDGLMAGILPAVGD